MANILNILYACFHWSFNGELKLAREPWVQGIWHPCVGCACFTVSFQDGTDINCLIWKTQELGTITLNSKVSLVLPSWAPAWCYPQASQGLKVQLGASAPFGACGVGTETTGPTWLNTCGKREGWRCSKYPWTHPKLWVASNAKLGLELTLACRDPKLEYVRIISQCFGLQEDKNDIWKGFRRRPETYIAVTPGEMTFIWIKPHSLKLPLVTWDPGATILSSLTIPCPILSAKSYPKLKCLHPLWSNLPCFWNSLFPSKISWGKSISYSIYCLWIQNSWVPVYLSSCSQSSRVSNP